MPKITIIGNSASGKSTLADLLSKHYKIPVHHLDLILWKKNWKKASEEQFTKKHDELVELNNWIIDGVGYTSTFRARFNAAELIIFLDTPIELCRKWAEKRVKEEKDRPDPYITSYCLYDDMKEEQIEVIEHFEKEIKPMLMELIEKYYIQKTLTISLIDNLNNKDVFEHLIKEIESVKS